MTDQPDSCPIYLASIALEPNRWKPAEKKQPSLKVSECANRASEAGFAGIELWEHHYFPASPKEKDALADSACPIRIFNTYLLPGIDSLAQWEQVVEAVKSLGSQVEGIKFNLGKASVPTSDQVQSAIEWAALLPESVHMLCECHPGTVIERPEAAAKAFEAWPAERFSAILHPMGTAPGHCDAWFGALNGRIRHLHWQARDEDNRVCALRERPEIFAVAKESLHQQAFKGTQSVEFVRGTGRPDESVEGLFEEACRDLASLREIQRG